VIVACPDHEAGLELGPSRGGAENGEENTKALRVFSSFFSVSPCDRFQLETGRVERTAQRGHPACGNPAVMRSAFA
jgi:hypothetical protein